MPIKPAQPTIDTLLRLLPTSPTSTGPSGPEQLLQTYLPTHPTISRTADVNGYTLLHAIASYASPDLPSSYDLLRTLVTQYRVPVNVADAEGDTPLFYAERVETVRILVEELGADWSVRNVEGITAEDNAVANREDEDGTTAEGWAGVADFLSKLRSAVEGGVSIAGNGNTSLTSNIQGDGGSQRSLPPLPPGMSINVATVTDAEAVQGVDTPDPEFRARIEALAARPDFEDDKGQEELKRLVEDAVGGLAGDADGNVMKRGKYG